MAVSEKDFLDAWSKLQSVTEVAKHLGLSISSVNKRRQRLKKSGFCLPSRIGSSEAIRKTASEIPVQIDRAITGTVVVFSDAHYWPGSASPAHEAMLRVIKKIKPSTIIANGDIFDGASISRHGRIGWQHSPTVIEELNAVVERLEQIKKAAKGAELIRTIGNHCVRFETYLAAHAPAFEGALGFELRHHLPDWEPTWSVFINGNTMVKHRWHNGIHAAYNNALKSGLNIVTGHLHRLCVTPWGDYTGRRYGVDTGTLSDPKGEQYYYLENNPTPWCGGFAVLTYDEDGRLLPPELCEVIDGTPYFRGQPV